MSITCSFFGKTADGQDVLAFTMTNHKGAYVRILNRGCVLQSIVVPDRTGKLTDVCLGYDDVASYENNDGYLGAAIGRYANRIGKGTFTLNGKTYNLYINNGENHLHGGKKGFDKYVWDHRIEADALIFTHTFPDGDENYPGNLDVQIKYTFDEDCRLNLEYTALCDQDTVVNLTNHCYFNLQGHGNILDHALTLYADQYTENDSGCLPTGTILDVAGSPFDFRTPKTIGRDIGQQHPQLLAAGGYDHNFILNGEHAATVYSEETGIVMDAYTDLPGVQFYCGNFLKDRTGKGGAAYGYRGGLCLETQFFPDSLSHPHFPSPVLKAGKIFRHTTTYQFGVRK